MKILYFDCFSGISGDMILGALVDLGVPLDYMKDEVKKLNISDVNLKSNRVNRCNISCTKVDVVFDEKKQTHRNFNDIKKIISKSKLNNNVKEKSIKIFEIIAKAEGKIHNVSIEKVHFHEVGAVDSIVDVVGAVIGIEYLKVDEVISSSINLGSGMVKTSHGIFPVPAPATLEILKGMKCYGSDVKMELCTPTGAAVISFYSEETCSFPTCSPENVGYGAGSYSSKEFPNVLRVLLGDDGKGTGFENLVIVDANIDDMNPEFYEHILEQSMKNGALDAFITPIIMKKGRPACKISVLLNEKSVEKISKILFTETTTFGIRKTFVLRKALERKMLKVKTKFGEVNVKTGIFNGKVVTIAPEFEDVKKISIKNKVSMKDVYDDAKKNAKKN